MQLLSRFTPGLVSFSAPWLCSAIVPGDIDPLQCLRGLSLEGMMRIYLDFDGVLHPTNLQPTGNVDTYTCADGIVVPWHPMYFCFVPQLHSVLSKFDGIEIFVHSSWRFMWRELRPGDFKNFLGPLHDKFIRCCPCDVFAPSRHALILEDMKADGYTGPWLAIDDFGDQFNYCKYDNVVITNPALGISPQEKLSELRSKISSLTGQGGK